MTKEVHLHADSDLTDGLSICDIPINENHQFSLHGPLSSVIADTSSLKDKSVCKDSSLNNTISASIAQIANNANILLNDTAAIPQIEELDKSQDYINGFCCSTPKSLGGFFPSFFHDDIPVLSPSCCR
jgi:hypothetical protein